MNQTIENKLEVPEMHGEHQEWSFLQTAKLYKLGRDVATNPTDLHVAREYTLEFSRYMVELGINYEQTIENLYRLKQHNLRKQRNGSTSTQN